MSDQTYTQPRVVDSSFWSEIKNAVTAIRAHLNMDVAFVSEFNGDSRVLRVVDAKGRAPVAEGDRIPQDAGYCRKVVEGELPQLIPDTGLCPSALDIPETRTMPIGAHLSLPIRLRDARVFGTFCCFSFNPDSSLNRRDLEVMRPLAERISTHIENYVNEGTSLAASAARIESFLNSDGPSIVYQPIYSLSPLLLNGAEALSRFEGDPAVSPNIWFDEAGKLGLRTALELKAIRNAVNGFRPLWSRSPLYLGLNSSPETILEGGLADALAGCPTDRVVLEITEHAQIADYDALSSALKPLRQQGMKLAVDDAGAGFASFRHILRLQPDIIKLDISLTRGIDTDRTRRALARALISFARETEGRIVAEGVETAAELDTLTNLGADAAQGYHLGRPAGVKDFSRMLNSAKPAIR